MNKKETKAFWAMAEKNRKEVATWSKWKRSIVISAETASTGQFIRR